eukprot:1249926-Rhodomonas_salina.2
MVLLPGCSGPTLPAALPLGHEVLSAITLRACYAMSGTGTAYGAARVLCDVRYYHSVCYAMSGTELGYAAMRRAGVR